MCFGQEQVSDVEPQAQEVEHKPVGLAQNLIQDMSLLGPFGGEGAKAVVAPWVKTLYELARLDLNEAEDAAVKTLLTGMVGGLTGLGVEVPSNVTEYVAS